jgi:hypothetical protein
MKKPVLKLIVAVVTLVTASSFAQTQPAATPAKAPPPAPKPPPPSAYDKWENKAKNPAPWISWGADVRLRNEYFNNALTLNKSDAPAAYPRGLNEQDYFRFRERIWASAIPVTNVSLNVRFSGEQREWMKPSYASQYGPRTGLEERYGIFDSLNVKWSNIGGEPLSLTAGRQDIMLGDPLNWWLVADGTPGDGSWTFFLDSLRASFEAKEIKTKFDLAYVYQNPFPDEWIPTLGRSSDNHNPPPPAIPSATGYRPYLLTEQKEQGIVLYGSNKSMKDTQIDGYFIFKNDQRVHTDRIPNGDNANIFTLGTKITGTPQEHLAYSVEGAYQFGSKQDPTVRAAYVDTPNTWHDLSAWGANGKLTYLCKDELKNQFSLLAEYLSGDNPDTKGKDEMFDVLWGRWPRYSELYIYSYVNETSGKIAQMNNIIRIGPNWTCSPIKNMTFSATYNAWFAPHDTPTRNVAPTLFSTQSTFRGHYLQTFLKHQFNPHVSAHLWGELVWMGDYYVHHDLMTFLRAEVMLTF